VINFSSRVIARRRHHELINMASLLVCLNLRGLAQSTNQRKPHSRQTTTPSRTQATYFLSLLSLFFSLSSFSLLSLSLSLMLPSHCPYCSEKGEGSRGHVGVWLARVRRVFERLSLLQGLFPPTRQQGPGTGRKNSEEQPSPQTETRRRRR